MLPSTLEGPTMRWFLKLLGKSIDCFEILADLFTNTYSDYHDTRKHHKTIRKGESFRANLKFFHSELVETIGWPPWLSNKAFIFTHLFSKSQTKKSTTTFLWRSASIWRMATLTETIKH
ncbi:hypothetical protein DVH24_002391 [Malus domestica]|uniref:Retrotransposon gag domain-containing protein n=1 Tax=Malus domestica TaxID=3750 RepID=A0A498IHP1_MALDO|nr:hypothetical protein DVH24_002391 [Malus domestica]